MHSGPREAPGRDPPASGTADNETPPGVKGQGRKCWWLPAHPSSITGNCGTAARLQKAPIARSYAVYMSNKFMSNKYSISTRSGLQGCSAAPAPSQGSLADAQWDSALLPCFSQLIVLGWGAQHRSPSLAFQQDCPCPPSRACAGGWSMASAACARLTAFLRRGLAPRARCSLQELPAFRSGGSASGTARTATGMG